jgi:hypothetical protein
VPLQFASRSLLRRQEAKLKLIIWGGRKGGRGERLYLGMEGHGGSGGSRVVVVLELVRLGVDAPDEEEAGDGGGEEDEDDPQRAHLKLQTPEGTNQSNQNERRGRGKSKAIEHRSPFSSPTNPGYQTRSQHFFLFLGPWRAAENEACVLLCGAPTRTRSAATRFASRSRLSVTSLYFSL